VGVFVQVHSWQRRKLGGPIAELETWIYNLIVARVVIAGCILTWALAAQTPPPSQSKPAPDKKVEEQEPPEEDDSLKPEEFTLNPLEAQRNITAGDFYLNDKVRRNYRAAANRYVRATKWDPGSSEAFFKLGECYERMKQWTDARGAYTKYLELAPDAKNAAQIKKKIAKWPGASPRQASRN
jgi:tetratricopeptide (TPR) repeat protein